MRKILVFTNISLDGYFEDVRHDISGFKNDYEAFSPGGDSQVDTLLFGHKTYEMMKFWATPQAEEMAPAVAKFINETLKVVASQAGFEPGWKNVRVISGNVVDGVRKLKAQPGQSIMIFGSNQLVVSLLQAGLIDLFQIVLNPVVFGEGTSLFTGLPRKTELRLTETRQFKSGALMLSYEPLRE